MYLSVPIPAGDCDVYSCIEAFLKEEILDGEDAWNCGRCKTKRRAVKKLDIWRLPLILLVHLKRFSFHGHFRDKIDKLVDFPSSNLSLSRFMVHPKGGEVYNLFAISNHYGGLNGGHCNFSLRVDMGCTRRPNDDTWYNFDDTRVTPLDLSQVKVAIFLFCGQLRTVTSYQVQIHTHQQLTQKVPIL